MGDSTDRAGGVTSGTRLSRSSCEGNASGRTGRWRIRETKGRGRRSRTRDRRRPPAPPKAGRDRARRRRPPSRQGRPKARKRLAPPRTIRWPGSRLDIPLADLDRPSHYLVPERLATQACPVCASAGAVRRSADRRFRAGPGERQRPSGAARLSGAGRVGGASAHRRDRGACARRRRPVRGHARRRPAAGDPAAACRDRIGSARRPVDTPGRPEPGPWDRYPAGRAFLDAIAGSRPARAAWTAMPGDTWPEEMARAAATCASTGRGAVIVVPDARDLARVDAALAEIGAGHVTLSADLGPAERYRRWLAALRGEALIVAGTRAAMFTPVQALGLVVLWDDGDDLHAEPRDPTQRRGSARAARAPGRSRRLDRRVRPYGRAGPARGVRWGSLAGTRPASLRGAAPLVRPAADDAELAMAGRRRPGAPGGTVLVHADAALPPPRRSSAGTRLRSPNVTSPSGPSSASRPQSGWPR